MRTIAELMDTVSSSGLVHWIGIRPGRRMPMHAVQSISVARTGLQGDHYSGHDKRALTLIQHEHLPVIAALSGHQNIDPAVVRRNIVVSGINLLALRKARFRIGNVLLEGSGICAPCSYMEEALGPGGYSAMRGHGGITARVLEAGTIALEDSVVLVKSGGTGEKQ